MSVEQLPAAPSSVVGDTTTPSQSVSVWYTDKALWVTVLGLLLPFVSKWVGITLDPARVAAFLIPVVAYIISHKAKSAAIVVAEIKARVAEKLGPAANSNVEAASDLNQIIGAKP